MLGFVRGARQFRLAEIANPYPAIRPEVARSPYAAHTADDLLVDEHFIDELRPAGAPIRQLLRTDAAEMHALVLGLRQLHRRGPPRPHKS
jgi:hypothetical protein